jgi:hypothetical protein
MDRRAIVGIGLLLAPPLMPETVIAEYALVLKNGRRIVVESYREERGMVKFPAFGGEIGIEREQIQSILKVGEGEIRGTIIPSNDSALPRGPMATPEANKPATSIGKAGARPQEKIQTPEEKRSEERAKEEKDYLKKLEAITEQIKSARDRYALATRGNTGPEPAFFTSPEAFSGQQDDLISRLRDAQHNPLGPPDAEPPKFLTPSPFSGVPPTTTEVAPPLVGPGPRADFPLPSYTPKQKELSELRDQINQLTEERERLIQQMRDKNFSTGSLFLQ